MSKATYMRRMTKYFMVFTFGLATTVSSLAQTGKVKGNMITSDQQPAAGVSITWLKTNRSTVSDANGQFEFNGIDTGIQRFVVQMTGLTSNEYAIRVTAEGPNLLQVKLPTTMKSLNEVIINSIRNSNEKVASSSRSNISNMDLPQTVGIISNTLIADQQAVRVGDVIRNVSGVSLSQTRLGVNETYTARGYSIGINGAAGSVLKNGLITNTSGMPEAATLESIEVMKGSTALLYGNVSGGLIINLITKKPQFNFGGEVKMLLGSYQQYKPLIDVYGPISKQIAYRLVATYENSQSFRDGVTTKRTYVNPSFLFKLGKRTTILVQGDYLDARLTPDFGVGMLDSGRVLNSTAPRSRFLNVNWAYNNVLQHGIGFQLQHQFNNHWQLSVAGSVQQTDLNSYGAGLPNVVKLSGDWYRPLARAHTVENNLGTQITLNGQFNTGKWKHQLTTGTDFTRIVTETDAYRITRNGALVTVYDTINIIDPGKYVTKNDVPDAILQTVTTAPSNRFGVFVQDLIQVAPRWKVLAGIRWSYQETIQTDIVNVVTGVNSLGVAPTSYHRAFSPKLGLLYQPSGNSTFFASYANNFTINTGTDIYGQQLKPSIIDQFEAGVKQQFFQGKLFANFSIYRILNSALAQQAQFRADGSLNADANVKELRGETTSDGLELDLQANLSKQVYAIVGYSYNNMRFTRTSGAKGSNIEGERVTNNPDHTINLAAFYTFNRFAIKGLKLGLSGYYTGNRMGGYNNTVAQTQIGSRLIPLDGFFTMDLSAAYSIKAFTLQAKCSNVLDALNYLVHDNYSIAPIAPRQLAVSVGYRF